RRGDIPEQHQLERSAHVTLDSHILRSNVMNTGLARIIPRKPWILEVYRRGPGVAGASELRLSALRQRKTMLYDKGISRLIPAIVVAIGSSVDGIGAGSTPVNLLPYPQELT